MTFFSSPAKLCRAIFLKKRGKKNQTSSCNPQKNPLKTTLFAMGYFPQKADGIIQNLGG